MNNFIYADVVSAFNYAKQNPDKSIEDWLNIRGNKISSEELKRFKDIKYNTFTINFDGKDSILYFIADYSQVLLNNFIGKFVGNKPHYLFECGDNYGFGCCILTFDDILNIKKWNFDEKDNDFKFLKYNEQNIEFYYNGVKDEYNHYLFQNKIDYLKSKSLYFYRNRIKVIYTGTIKDLNLKSIADLFELED